MTPEEKPAGRDWSRAVREAAPYLGLGTSLAVTVGLGLGLGYWLDQRFGTTPVFLLAGGILGMAVAGLGFYRSVSGRGK